jgi:hypothetical protein
MGKSLLLATGFAIGYLVVATMLFRLFAIQERARAMTLLFIASVGPLTAFFFMTPADLGFLPEFLTEPIFLVDFLFCMFLYAAAYGGGILQLYNLADRGFSLRIVIDVAKQPSGLTTEEIFTGYSDGKGLPWMYDKRIQNLLENEMCEVKEGRLRNLPAGTRLAKLFGRLRAFFHHPRIGESVHGPVLRKVA